MEKQKVFHQLYESGDDAAHVILELARKYGLDPNNDKISSFAVSHALATEYEMLELMSNNPLYLLDVKLAGLQDRYDKGEQEFIRSGRINLRDSEKTFRNRVKNEPQTDPANLRSLLNTLVLDRTNAQFTSEILVMFGVNEGLDLQDVTQSLQGKQGRYLLFPEINNGNLSTHTQGVFARTLYQGHSDQYLLFLSFDKANAQSIATAPLKLLSLK